MCACVYGNAEAHVSVCGGLRGYQVSFVIPHLSPLNLWLTVLASLTDQQAPGINMESQAPMAMPCLFMGVGGLYSGPLDCTALLSPEPFPQPLE